MALRYSNRWAGRWAGIGRVVLRSPRRGGSVPAYALVVGMVAVGVAASAEMVGGETQRMFDAIATEMNTSSSGNGALSSVSAFLNGGSGKGTITTCSRSGSKTYGSPGTFTMDVPKEIAGCTFTFDVLGGGGGGDGSNGTRGGHGGRMEFAFVPGATGKIHVLVGGGGLGHCQGDNGGGFGGGGDGSGCNAAGGGASAVRFGDHVLAVAGGGGGAHNGGRGGDGGALNEAGEDGFGSPNGRGGADGNGGGGAAPGGDAGDSGGGSGGGDGFPAFNVGGGAGGNGSNAQTGGGGGYGGGGAGDSAGAGGGGGFLDVGAVEDGYRELSSSNGGAGNSVCGTGCDGGDGRVVVEWN